MTRTAKLKADTGHVFVQTVKKYRDEGFLRKEFRHRQEVQAARSSGVIVHDSVASGTSGGGRPNLTPDETRELVDQIIAGKIVPDAMQVHNLAFQFGLVGSQITAFINLGGQYVIHCFEHAGPKRIYLDFPPGEDLHDALVGIITPMRANRREDAILRPGDPGYTKTIGTPAVRKLRIAFSPDDSSLVTKIYAFILRSAGHTMNPSLTLFTDMEIDRVAQALRLTDKEKIRLELAQDNTASHMAFLQLPEMQDAVILQILEELGKGDEGKYKVVRRNSLSGARGAFLDMLHTRQQPARHVFSLADRDILRHSDPEFFAQRQAIVDRVFRGADLDRLEGMAVFKERLLREPDLTFWKVTGSLDAMRKATEEERQIERG